MSAVGSVASVTRALEEGRGRRQGRRQGRRVNGKTAEALGISWEELGFAMERLWPSLKDSRGGPRDQWKPPKRKPKRKPPRAKERHAVRLKSPLDKESGDDPVGLILVSIERARSMPPSDRMPELRVLGVLQRCFAFAETARFQREIEELMAETREEIAREWD